jgi:ABC-type polysaccharide/polyol phosphate export permease
MFSQIWRHRVMVWGLVQRDLQARYAGSALGMVWTFLHPLLLLLVYLVVFSWILRVRFTVAGGSGDFALYLLAGLLPWLAFQEGVIKAAAAVVENAVLVKGACFPAAVLVASGVLASIVNLFISLGVFLLALLLTSHLSWSGLLFLPLLVCLQVTFAFGLGLVAAGLYTFLRDMMPLLQVGFMVWFYLTPIIYPLSYVPEWLLPLFSCNPLTPLITAYRAVLLEGAIPSQASLMLASAWTVGTLFLGSLIFTWVEPGFADVL